MQKLTLLTSSILTAALALSACGGGGSDSPTTNPPAQPSLPPIKPTPPTDTKPVVVEKNTLSGRITDVNNVPIAKATIKLGSSTVITDQTGTYRFDLNNALNNDINTRTLTVKKSGYATSMKTIPLVANQAYKLDIALAKDQVSEAFATSNFGIAKLNSEARAEISPNSVAAKSGQLHNGTANLAASYYGPDSAIDARAFTLPFSGKKSDGKTITDFANVGLIEVKLTDTSGQDLTLVEGYRATLVFPEVTNYQKILTIPLWHYDEKTATWIEEGVAQRQTDNGDEGKYEAEVYHLGLWALGIPLDQHSAVVEGCTVDSVANQPSSNFKLIVGGQGFKKFTHPKSSGSFSIAVPINTPLLLSPVQHQVSFQAVPIPALARNEVYNVNNGQCIVTTKSNNKGLIDLNIENDSLINQLSALPTIVKPALTSLSFKRPLTLPAPKENISRLGYQFELVDDAAVKDILIKELRSYVSSNNRFNDTSYFLQSLYADNDKYVRDYQYWSKKIMAPNELLESSAQGARYPGPYLETPNEKGPDIAAIIQYDATFKNNQLIRNYYDKLLVVNTYRDQPLANQKIGDVLFYGVPRTPTNIEIINTLNRLPAATSAFDSKASCKILSARSTNVDYIEYVTVTDGQQNNYANIKTPLVNPISGSWFQDDPIKWSAEKATNAAGISRAVVKYDNGSYDEGIYVRANTLTVSPTEAQQCDIYNEAAKNQILEALNKVTLPSSTLPAK